MPSRKISHGILKKFQKKHARAVIHHYQPKHMMSLLRKKKPMLGKKHGIEIGSMAHIKQEVAMPVINKVLHRATKSVKHPDQKMKKVGKSVKQTLHAKPLKAGAKAKKAVEKVHKRIHVKK